MSVWVTNRGLRSFDGLLQLQVESINEKPAQRNHTDESNEHGSQSEEPTNRYGESSFEGPWLYRHGLFACLEHVSGAPHRVNHWNEAVEIHLLSQI